MVCRSSTAGRAPASGLGGLCQGAFCAGCGYPTDDPGNRSEQPESDSGLQRNGQLGTRCLSRDRRLCCRDSAYYELNNGWLQLAVALGASGIFALLTGLVCLRTRGAYFIMITLAFAQMMYFIFVSIEEYGGDDGLVIYSRSEMDLALI